MHHWRRIFLPCIIAAVLLLGERLLAAESQPFSPVQRGASRNIFGYDPTSDFLKLDPEYPQKHRQYAQQLRELQLELARQASKGRPTPCSRQLFLEARWLVYYSAHWERIERRLNALAEMLRRP